MTAENYLNESVVNRRLKSAAMDGFAWNTMCQGSFPVNITYLPVNLFLKFGNEQNENA